MIRKGHNCPNLGDKEHKRKIIEKFEAFAHFFYECSVQEGY